MRERRTNRPQKSQPIVRIGHLVRADFKPTLFGKLIRLALRSKSNSTSMLVAIWISEDQSIRFISSFRYNMQYLPRTHRK